MRRILVVSAAVAAMLVGGASVVGAVPASTKKLAAGIATVGHPVAGHKATLKLTASRPAGDTLLSYSLNFGDHSKVMKGKRLPKSITHLYTHTGRFTVTLAIIDKHHKVASHKTTVLVAAPVAKQAPCVFLYGTTNSCSSNNPQVVLDNSLSGDSSACTFNESISWGDGTPPQAVSVSGGSTGAEFVASHSYAHTGTYTISQSGSVTSPCGFFTPATYTYTRHASPTAPATATAPCAFQLNGSIYSCASTNSTAQYIFDYFGNTSSCAFTTNISWGDGTSAQNLATGGMSGPGSLPLASHTFGGPGSYTIRITGSATGGCYYVPVTYQLTIWS